MYGKFVNGVFHRAPYRITAEEARLQGFKPVVLTPAPDTDDEHYPMEWLEDAETEIVRHWTIEAIQPDPDPDLDDSEALDILLGGKDE